MQSLKYFLPTLVLATASFEAYAQDDDKLFVEAYAGAISADFGSDFANDFTLVGTRFGYNFTSILSIEADLSTGTNTQSRSTGFVFPRDTVPAIVGVEKVDEQIESVFGVFGKATLPINDRFSGYARLGLAEIKTGMTRDSQSNSEIGTFRFENTYNEYNAALGLGATFDITDNIYARADFTRYGLKPDIFEPEFDSATIGAGFRF